MTFYYLPNANEGARAVTVCDDNACGGLCSDYLNDAMYAGAVVYGTRSEAELHTGSRFAHERDGIAGTVGTVGFVSYTHPGCVVTHPIDEDLTVVDAPEPSPAGESLGVFEEVHPLRLLPRSAADATTLAAVLQDVARFLPGGELESTAHEQAGLANLCGEYEAIVCPTFGWLPRNGEESSMARRSLEFFAEMDRWEDEHATLPLLERLRLWSHRYERGGYANCAVVDHADSHLEQEKRDSLNALLVDTLGWEPIPTTTEYEVTVRIERQRTITEHTYATVTVTADDADEAGDLGVDLAEADYYADWEVDDDNYDSSETDREVYEVNDA